ncbi:MAG: hypothetical protein ABIO63_02175 [Casimicrobiaceae bacterium]
MSFADSVNKLIKEAPSIQGGGAFVNFGPLTVTPMVVTFKGSGQMPDKRTLQEYMEEQGLEEGDDIELSDRDSFQLRFVIAVDEINPALTFQYEREVSVLASNDKIKTDWDAIVLPSLVKVFGKDWYTKLIQSGSKKVKRYYVSAENTESLKPVKEGKKNYGVPKFLAVYDDAEACKEARDERYPPRENATETIVGSDDDGSEEEGFTDEQLEQALTLYNSTKKNEKRTIAMLGKMFPDIDDPKALLDAALETEE